MKTVSLFTLEKEAIESTFTLLTEETLQSKKFKPCGKHDMKRMGFSENLDGLYVSNHRGDLILTVTEQEKKVEAYAVKTLLQEFEESYAEENEGFSPTKKMKEEQTHKIIEELLPLTPAKEPKKYRVLFCKDGTVFTEATGKKAEDVLSLIRKTIDTLPVVPYEPLSSLGDLLDELVAPEVNENTGNLIRPLVHDRLELLNKGTFIDPDGRKHSLSGETLYNSQAQELIKEGAYTTQVELSYDGVVTLNIKDDFTLTGIKYSESISAEDDHIGTEFLQLAEIKKVISEFITHLKLEDK